MRVLLLNDTATEPHIGCQAVSDAHARMLGAAGHTVAHRYFVAELRHLAGTDEQGGVERVLADEVLREKIESVDAVIVNGEGTLHHGAGSEYYAVLGAAQRLGKGTMIVNAVFEANAGWQTVLQRLDDFCVRDARSLACASALGLNCRLVPDSFLGASFEGDHFVELSEQMIVTDWHHERDADVGETLRTILAEVEGAFYFPMLHGVHSMLWRQALACWSRASCVITARHHGVYLAIAAGRPFVAMPSNTMKVEGLIEAAGVKIPVCTRADQVVEGLRYAMEHLDEYRRLADFLASQTPLTTFRALGVGASATSVEVELALLSQQVQGKSWAPQPRFWGLANRTARAAPRA